LNDTNAEVCDQVYRKHDMRTNVPGFIYHHQEYIIFRARFILREQVSKAITATKKRIQLPTASFETSLRSFNINTPFKDFLGEEFRLFAD